MYQIEAIKTQFANLVGFAQMDLGHFAKLPDSITKSTSGIIANDAHPLLNYTNIIAAILPENDAFYRAYDAARTYGVGDVVRVAPTQLYRSKIAENASEPSSTAAGWEVTTHVAEELRKIYNTAVQRMTSELFIQKKLAGRGREVLEDTKLFYSVGNHANNIIKKGRFVGVEMVLRDLQDLALVVNEVGLHTTKDNVDFPLYIYHGSRSEPVDVLPLRTARGWDFSWNPVEALTLKENLNGPYNFIVGYYEDDLDGNAISISKDWMNQPCSQCSRQDPPAFRAWSPYIKFHPFSVDQNYILEDRSLFPLEKKVYDYATNFGLNFRVAITCDVTDSITRSKQAFAPALQKWIAVVLLETIGYSTNVNAIVETSKLQARYILDPGSFTKGLKAEAMDAIKTLDIDISSQNSRCLKAHKRPGIRSGAA